MVSGNQGNAAIRAELVAAVMDTAGGSARGARRILDAGCGSGWWLEQVAAMPGIHASVHGVLLPDRVTSAKSRVPEAAIVVGDVRKLSYETGRFDVVSLFTVLSSLATRRDITQALADGMRVLAPGGVLLIWEPRLPNPANRATLLVGERLVRDASPGCCVEVRTITLLPPLARRLGTRTDKLYRRLARVGALRSHRLMCVRATAPPT